MPSNKPSSSVGNCRKRYGEKINDESRSIKKQESKHDQSDSSSGISEIELPYNPIKKLKTDEFNDSLALSDESDIEEELSFSQQIALKNKKKEEKQKKKVEEIIAKVDSECSVSNRKYFGEENVLLVSQYDQIQEDLARINQINKRFLEKRDSTNVIEDEEASATISKAKCILRIIDINDVKYNDYGRIWEMDAPFKLLRDELSERKGVDPLCTSLTFNQQEIRDHNTPNSLDFLADKVYTIEVVTVARKIDKIDEKVETSDAMLKEKLNIKCVVNKKKFYNCPVEKGMQFSLVRVALRTMGYKFKEMLFNGLIIEDTHCPNDLGIEDGDIIDLV